jgi:hypothetical protein
VTIEIFRAAKMSLMVMLAVMPRGLAGIGLNGKFLRFRRDGVSISYTVICLSHFDVFLAIT